MKTTVGFAERCSGSPSWKWRSWFSSLVAQVAVGTRSSGDELRRREIRQRNREPLVGGCVRGGFWFDALLGRAFDFCLARFSTPLPGRLRLGTRENRFLLFHEVKIATA